MTIEDPFESPKLLLQRAKEHFLDLHQREKAFFETDPYTRFVEPDPDPRYQLYKLRMNGNIPNSYRAVMGDAFNNLRHALDQAVVASARCTGATKFKKIYFPFGDTPKQFEGVIREKCDGVHPDVVDYIRDLKPYRGGNPLLCLLTRLAGSNKHQVLMTVDATTDGIIELVRNGATGGEKVIALGKWDRAKNELTVARVLRGAKPDYSLNLRFNVMLDDQLSGIKGPVLPMVRTLGMIVDSAVGTIEAITQRAIASKDT